MGRHWCNELQKLEGGQQKESHVLSITRVDLPDSSILVSIKRP
jgi:hypothetical protein